MRCTRFRADGTACTNETANADGWCREPECSGFLRSSRETAPVNLGSPQGTARHIERTADLPIEVVGIEDILDVAVTTRATDSFRFHHGGGKAQAEIQLRIMLEDFLLKSARGVSEKGYIALARDGYKLILSPGGDVIVNYSTVHRERTWEQFKAGVPSRFRSGGRARGPSGVPREFCGPPPASGPPIDMADFWKVFDVDGVHLTGRVRRSFARIEDLGMVSDDELDTRLRACLAELDPGEIAQRDDGFFTLVGDGRVWLVGPDGLSVIGVKKVSAEIH